MSICSIVSQHTCRALSRAASDLKVWNTRSLLRCQSFCSSSARFEVTCRSGRAAPSGICQRRISLREYRNSKRPVMTSAVQDEAVIDVEAETIDERVPCTIITGFLGSGKTTLLNHILKSNHGKRIAVIENEFGEIDIDSDLVALQENLGEDGEQIMMLNNGCLCCTVKEDLVKMLVELYERRDKFDQIVIETTGLANPAPIIQTFFAKPEVAERMSLDGVVTLVDALHVERHLDDIKVSPMDGFQTPSEAMQQIAYADRIILNKIDLVKPEDLLRLEERIKGINGMAGLVRAEKAVVEVDYVLGVGGFDLSLIEEQFSAPKEPEAHSHSHSHEEEHDHDHATCTNPDHDHSHDHKHEHGHEHEHEHAHDGHAHAHEHDHDHATCTDPTHDHSHHHHDDAVTSVSIVIDGDMDLDNVNFWLGQLLQLKSDDLYRIKGVLSIAGDDHRFVFQGVHQMFNGMADRLWKETDKRQSRMVFIGRDLDGDLLRSGFIECLASKKGFSNGTA